MVEEENQAKIAESALTSDLLGGRPYWRAANYLSLGEIYLYAMTSLPSIGTKFKQQMS
jgi:hypothetical protein